MTNTKYNTLVEHFKKAALLGEISGILGWDQNTYLPLKAGDGRGEQMAEISGQIHGIISSEAVGELTEDLFYFPERHSLTQDETRNVALMHKAYIHAACIPPELVQKRTKASVNTEMKWRNARKANDFKAILPYLEDLVQLTREEAEFKSEKLQLSKYEALLDQYDSGRKTSEIDEIFGKLKTFIPQFIERARHEVTEDKISAHYPIAKQNEMLHHFMEKLGFDFDRGRLDTTSHPFCTGSGDDVRITTRYNENNFLEAFLGVVHETGHAMYEMNLPSQFKRQLIGDSNGMSTHESQSLFVEKQLCRNPAFIEYLYKVAHDTFGKLNFSPDELRSHILQIKPSYIRVDADEATYPAHVIIRYELERDMIEGKMEVADLPDAFNSKMQELLGITPKSDADGCMQDIHWYCGLMGYFPTYTLGSMTAAQMMATAVKDLGNQNDNFANGNFDPVMGWVKKNVHDNANKYDPSELVKVATGEHLNSQYFINHLEERYDKNR